MLTCAMAYDGLGRILGIVDVHVNPGTGDPVDFTATEEAGTDLLRVFGDTDLPPGTVGVGSWPEWLGVRAGEFTVGLDTRRPPRIVRLIHASGHVRERSEPEDAIRARQLAGGGVARISDLVGAPFAPLRLTADGRTHPDRFDWTDGRTGPDDSAVQGA